MTDEQAYEFFRLGGSARVAGEAMSTNPYKIGTDEYKHWLSGWLDMEAHLTSRDACLDELGWFG